MQIEQAVETLIQNKDKKCILGLTVKNGETVSIMNGLIEIEVDLDYHNSRPLLRFKAPRFISIFRVKKTK